MKDKILAHQANSFKLLHRLQDGQYHSGEQLAEHLGVSRAAVWKHIKKLKQYGIQIEARTSSGYRLQRPIEVLSEELIGQELNISIEDLNLEVLSITDSTNTVLMQRIIIQSIHKNIVLAEYQEAGRGRRGNDWQGTYASGITLSLGWHFAETPNNLSLLSLYVGNLIVACLIENGLSGLELKWPNDILHQGNKLAGILIEMRGEAGGAYDVVVGLGINYDLPDSNQMNISQTWTDINKISRTKLSRNTLVASIINHLITGMSEFEKINAEDILAAWSKQDYLTGQLVDIRLADTKESGTVKGIDNSGALIVKVNGNLKYFSSGEVSVRKVIA